MQNAYDYGRITISDEYFIPCTLVVEEEEIILQFEQEGLKPLSQLREEKEEDKLLFLADAMKMSKLLLHYQFELHPDNLFYDDHFKAAILMRDVYAEGCEPDKEDIIKKEIALCGYVMQSKYAYEDYYEGGVDLLKKNKKLKEICNEQDIEKMYMQLMKMRQQILEEKKKNVREVKKNIYLLKTILSWVFPIFTILLIGIGIYYYQTIGKIQKTLLTADNCYIDGNSISLIDKMETLSVEQMDLQHKYILAQAYIKSEDLTVEQKENILSSFNLTSNEKIMEYWIHIGRLEVLEAENIAMQYSDNELLLYAYMKDKALTERNTVMDGEEKQRRLSELESKIEDLSEPYLKEEE